MTARLSRQRRGLLRVISAIIVLQTLSMLVLTTMIWQSGVTQSRKIIDNSVLSISTAASERIEGFVGQANGAVELSSRVIDSAVVSGAIDEATEGYLLELLQTYPSISSAYIGYDNGDFIIAGRSDDEPGYPLRIKRIQHVDGERSVELQWYSETLAVGPAETDPSDEYDPRTRPWFAEASASSDVIWTNPYVFFTSRQPGVTVAKQLQSADGVERVFAVDVDVSEIQDFVQRIPVSPTGRAVLIAQDGSVVAAPGLREILADDERDRVLPTLSDFSPPVSSLERVFEESGGLEAQRTGFDSDGQLMEAATTGITVGDDTWQLALYGPATEFAVGQDRSVFRELVMIVGLSSLSLALTVILARRVRRGVVGLAQTAASDELTGLANRRKLTETGERCVDAVADAEAPLSVAIVDIDHFKQINDTHGHAAGDAALVAVAEAFTAETRSGDIVGRYAGDEFVVLMPNTPTEIAVGVINRAVHRVRSIDLESDVSVSAGVATMHPDDTMDLEQLIAAADTQLYEAKRGGRDRVSAALS